MLLMIDNFDSFTYNLVRYFEQLSQHVQVARNNAIDIEEINSLNPKAIIISPGPQTPDEAGISLDVIKHFAGRIPILGVCLGHQCIAKAYGGKIVKANKLMHGKTSEIHYINDLLFQDLPNPFTATRYHSLVVERSSCPSCFDIIAEVDNEIMAIRHRHLALLGVQFHPESILTTHGLQILKNFILQYVS